MVRNQSQQFKVDTERKVGKQSLVMHGDRVVTAKGYFKNVDLSMTAKEALENCVIVD